MKKNGFVSTSLIYAFFIIFLLLMIFLLNSYSRVRFFLDEIKYDIKDSFAEASLADINLYFMVYNEKTGEYELKDEIPYFGYDYDSTASYCKNASSISYMNGNITISAARKDTCYAYFKPAERDIILNIYTKETEDSKEILVNNIPNTSYKLTSKSCSNSNTTITFNEETRKFTINSKYKTECDVVFTRRDMDIVINLYKQVSLGYGTHTYKEKDYVEVEEIPGSGYSLYEYNCENDNATITESNGEIFVESSGKDVCNLYYDGGTSSVELIVMVESDSSNAVSGFTTGKKYIRYYGSNPGSNYAYVGYICDDSNATVTYKNGTLIAESTTQTTCRAYFNSYNSDNTLINYFLEKSDGTYESVVSVPELGYIYSHGSCQNGSTFKVNNNYVVVSPNTTNEVCNFYYDLAIADIKVLVYVMNRETSKYELGSVPVVGYRLQSAGCTNGASIEYVNSALEVTNDGPTVCTVYFV